MVYIDFVKGAEPQQYESYSYCSVLPYKQHWKGNSVSCDPD